MKRNTHILLVCGVMMIWCGCTSHHPTVAELRAQQRKQDSISLHQYQQSLAYTDSMLQTILPQTDTLLREFEYKKESNYEDVGRYVHKSLQTIQNTKRCFLQPSITDQGTLALRSYYFGAPIKHTRVQLSVDSVSRTWEGRNYVMETSSGEWLTLDEPSSLELLHMIDAFSNCRVQVTLLGKTKYSYVLSNGDKKALISSLRLTVRMKDVQNLEAQVRQSSLQIQKYQKRLEKR